MKSFLARFLKKQKLLLGILWLMLRGSSADSQELTLSKHITCYKKRYLTPAQELYYSIIQKNDFSIALQTENKNLYIQSLSFQTGHNFRKKTIGIDVSLNRQENTFYTGPFLRFFPFDRSEQPFTLMVEFKYIASLNKDIMRDRLSVSTGLIVRDPFALTSSFGIEIFENMTTDITVSNGLVFYSGLRVHYYIYGR